MQPLQLKEPRSKNTNGLAHMWLMDGCVSSSCEESIQNPSMEHPARTEAAVWHEGHMEQFSAPLGCQTQALAP